MLLGSLAACSKMDDTQVTLYDDAAITSFTLGTVNRYVNGEKSTFSGSDYQYRTVYSFNGLNEIKPAMIDEATKNARSAAEKFAKE